MYWTKEIAEFLLFIKNNRKNIPKFAPLYLAVTLTGLGIFQFIIILVGYIDYSNVNRAWLQIGSALICLLLGVLLFVIILIRVVLRKRLDEFQKEIIDRDWNKKNN